MNKQEFIERMRSLKNLFGNKSEYVEIEAVIELASELDKPQKVTVPQFVADWIEEGRKHCEDVFDLFGFDFTNEEVGNWFLREKPFDLVARAWLDGYEIEQEKRYYVRFKGMESGDFNYLNFIKFQHAWVLSSIKLDKKFRTEHTRKQLEDANFGWVFDCPGIEIEEVE